MKKRLLFMILFLLAFAFKATAQPGAPAGDANQTFCSDATVSDLVPNGSDPLIKWYDSSSGGSLLDGSETLTDATHYYASQTVAGEESTDRLDVLVTIDAPTISGITEICDTGTSSLSGTGTPATSNPWISDTPGVATVDNDGNVTGVAAGTSIITYTDINGCSNTVTVTVHALPTITGTPDVCMGATATLTGSGTAAAVDPWISGTPAYATISNTGLLTGVAAGSSLITYTDNNGCSTTVSATVNALPDAPSGSATQSFCTGKTVADLLPSGPNIKWYTASSGGSLLLSTDVLATGNYYASQTSGCESTDRLAVAVTVNSLPTITGALNVCVGSTLTLTGSGSPALSNPWSSASTVFATINDAGLVTGISPGSSLITYTDINGCSNTATMNVNSRTVPVITGSNAVCIGSTGNIYSTEAGMSDYQWLVSAGGTITAGGNAGDHSVTVTWTASGPKTVSVNYTDLNGCTAVSSTVYNVNVESGIAYNVAITGSLTEGGKLIATYKYDSPHCFPDDRSMTRYLWYKSNKDDHDPFSNITSTNGDSTLVLSAISGNYIRVDVQIYNGSTWLTAVSGGWTTDKVAANSKPVADTIIITGTALVNETLTGSYSYFDAENDAAQTPGYQWFRANDVNGTVRGKITGATSSAYKLTAADAGKYIGLKIVPKSSVGSSPGDTATMSAPWFGPVVANAPVVSNLRVLGVIKSGLTVFSSYDYYDNEGDLQGSSIIKWYKADNAAGTINKVKIATSSSYRLTDAELGKYVGFSVVPLAQTGVTPGDSVTLSAFAGVVTNDKPVVSNLSITGSGTTNVNDILTGTYDYSDNEGDLQGTSVFEWLRSPNSTLASATTIPSAASISYQLTLADTGKYIFFRVTPKARTGASPGDPVSIVASSKVNTPPYAVKLPISGTVEVGQTLTGHYEYHDGDGDSQSGSTYRWLRGGSPIPLATEATYIIAYEDEGSTLRFEVTPKSSSGYPNTGNPVVSDPTIPVANTSTAVPVADEVCIQGNRARDEVLTGKYRYDFPSKAEGTSVYRWLRGTDSTGYVEIGTGLTHIITDADMAENMDIVFEVTPESGTPVKTGVPVKSNPLAKILLPQDSYSVLVDTVILAATIPGGIFSGPGVTNGIFSPSAVGDDTDPYKIVYDYYVVNSTTVCTQNAFKNVMVVPPGTYFEGYLTDDIFSCHNTGTIKIQVKGIDTTAYTSAGFYINSFDGSDYNDALIPGVWQSNTWTVSIDPTKVKPGKFLHELYFYYFKDGFWNYISKPLEVEMVSTAPFINNLKAAYCKEDDDVTINVEGLYPPGGSVTWTGDLLTSLNTPSTVFQPGEGVPTVTYPVTFQYTTANGCISGQIGLDVTINPMPNPIFNLNDYYNVEGDPFTLVPIIARGGYISGDGVVGNRFLPDIAGTGPHDITYSIVDRNGCAAELTKRTNVRAALGSFVNLPSVICYRDTTYNISVNTTGLPESISIIDFSNSRGTLEHVPGAKTASYNIAETGQGNDTISFSYLWDGVPFTISKAVYIDKIGKITITGLKDNYCDYDATATLRVLVENSTGSGNFSFSGPDSSFTNYGILADFYPSKTPSSDSPYTVSYTHVSNVYSSGCRKNEQLLVNVNKSPDIEILNTRTTVNIKEQPVSLSGLPAESVFSGNGVYLAGSGYVFDPMVAGLGDIEILMSFRNEKGCLSTMKDTLIVSQAYGTILGLNTGNQYCYDGTVDTITYTSPKPWFSGTFSGQGITNQSPAKAVFNPSEAGKGDHEIIFTYQDKYGTVFDVSSILNVDSLGQIVIQNLLPGAEFCNNMEPFELYTSHKDGIFDGPVISGSLDPSRAIGDTSVIYTYTNQSTGCFITGRVPFTILEAPVISFTTADVCIENDADSIRFINHTTSASPVSTWEWGFSDVGGTDGSNKENPGYLFKTGGMHLVNLTATTGNGCSDTKTSTIDIGIKPAADFHWENECFIPDTQDSLLLFDATIAPSPIFSRSWSFSGGAVYGVDDKVRYPKEEVGLIPVEYIVRTKYPGCFDRIVKNIFVRPTVKLTKDNYFENFESGNGGWVNGDESLNCWSFGTPDRSMINTAASGINAWYTSFDVANQKVDSSSIVSPCFDFTETERPMINLKMWKNFDINRDGAALQYRIGDIGSWQYIGSLDDGINWYNSTLIKGRPGGDQVGWTTIGTPDNKWIEARHNLDELKGKKDVKFRIVYGSEGNSQNNDGLAFDDIMIGERTRNVLIEHFANYSSPASAEATEMIDNFALSNKDIINIQYHTNFPGIDSFYLDNPGDASARILFYGLTRAPYAFVDGGTGNYASIFDFTDKELDGSLVNINVNEISRRTLINPVFDIRLDPPVITGGVLQIGGRMAALRDLNSDNLTLYLVVTESVNSDYTGTGGVNTFHNVFRKFIPDAGGIDLKKTWIKGDEITFPGQTWVIEKTLNSSDIDIIAFIQDNVTKEVFQAVSVSETNISTQIERPDNTGNSGFALYPNPAKAHLTIEFGERADKDLTINIYDFRGAVTRTYTVPSGESGYIIDDLGLPDGIYLIRVSAGGIDLGFKKLIITGS